MRLPRWLDAILDRLRRSRRRESPRDVYAGLRTQALSLDPASIVVPTGEPWHGAAMAVMELAVEKGTASVVAVADGSVSLYLSTGGGVIGAGGHASVRDAAGRFRLLAGELRGAMAVAVDGFPLPEAGEVRFHVTTGEERYSSAAPESALRSGRHPLAQLYAAGQDLLTEIRLSTPDGEHG